MRVLCVAAHTDRPQSEILIALKNRGVDLHLMIREDAPFFQRFVESGVPVTPIALKGRLDIGSIRQIRKVLQEEHFDILHLFENRSVSNGIWASYGIPVKVICYRGIVGNVSYWDPASWMTYLNPKVSRITCVCNAIRDYFHQLRFLGYRFPRHKAMTLYKGHDLAWYHSEPADLKGFGIPEGSFVVGCAANIRPRKGIPVLVEAMAHLIDLPEFHLLLIGNMENAELLGKIANSPAAERIHLSGFRNDAPAILAACDMSVLPSLEREGLPRSVIESMAYATPAVVTDSGGSPELVEDRVSGLVVPPGDAVALAAAIRTLHDDPELRQRMGKASRQRIASCFNIEHSIEQTFDLYKELSDKSQRG